MQLLPYLKQNLSLRDLSGRIKLVWVAGGARGDDFLKYVKKSRMILQTDPTVPAHQWLFLSSSLPFVLL
jgi:hypothetical protein